MARNILLIILIGVCGLAGALVPPHPKYQNIPSAWEPTRLKLCVVPRLEDKAVARPPRSPARNRILPQNILALRVQFSDVSFIQQASYPISNHDTAFFRALDAASAGFLCRCLAGRNIMNYHVYRMCLPCQRPMSYYGADTSQRIDAQLPQILPDLMLLCDDLIDFTQYHGSDHLPCRSRTGIRYRWYRPETNLEYIPHPQGVAGCL